jgi:hypothetical protein
MQSSGNDGTENEGTHLPESMDSGKDILFKLSDVDLVTKYVMHVQVIIIPLSGMKVSFSEFVQSGAGQYTTAYELEPG